MLDNHHKLINSNSGLQDFCSCEKPETAGYGPRVPWPWPRDRGAADGEALTATPEIHNQDVKFVSRAELPEASPDMAGAHSGGSFPGQRSGSTPTKKARKPKLIHIYSSLFDDARNIPDVTNDADDKHDGRDGRMIRTKHLDDKDDGRKAEQQQQQPHHCTPGLIVTLAILDLFIITGVCYSLAITA